MSYSHRYRKQSYWQSNTGWSTTHTDRTRLSRGVRPWKSSSNGRRLDHTTSSHRNWTTDGGHVTPPHPAARAPEASDHAVGGLALMAASLLLVVFEPVSGQGDMRYSNRISALAILSPCKSAPYLWLQTAVSLLILGDAVLTKNSSRLRGTSTGTHFQLFAPDNQLCCSPGSTRQILAIKSWTGC